MFWTIVIIFIVAGIIYGVVNDSNDKKKAGERKDVLDIKLKELPNQQSLKKVIRACPRKFSHVAILQRGRFVNIWKVNLPWFPLSL